MNKKMLLLWMAFLLSSLLWSQKQKDFLLTMKGDTLYGKIAHDSKAHKILFRYQGNKMEFHASTIKYFGLYQKGKYRTYKTMQNDKKKIVFVEVLTEGTLNLYLYNTIGDKRYENGDDFRYFICKEDMMIMRVTPRSYKNILIRYIKDYPYLLDQEIEYQDVPRIIKAYNDLTSLEARD